MFVLLPVGMNYRTERLPIVTFGLIGINTLIYLISLVFFFGTRGESDLWIFQHLWLTPSESMLWTYLTSMFVHAGFFHLFGNMIFLFLFGCCVEDIIGRWQFLAFYLAGGLAAELAYIVLTPEHFASDIPMGGASGAISTCMGMYLLLRANADIEFKYFYFLLIFGGVGSGDFSLPAWMAISFWFMKDLFWMVLGYFYEHGGGGVAFGAHVGGFLAGLALIGIYHWMERRRGEPDAEATAMPLPALAVVETHNETPTIYLHEGGVQSGPFNQYQIQQMLSLGSISREAVYWSEGMTDWANVLELSDRPPG
jgi:membrane associated rhomboid family serine protease